MLVKLVEGSSKLIEGESRSDCSSEGSQFMFFCIDANTQTRLVIKLEVIKIISFGMWSVNLQ